MYRGQAPLGGLNAVDQAIDINLRSVTNAAQVTLYNYCIGAACYEAFEAGECNDPESERMREKYANGELEPPPNEIIKLTNDFHKKSSIPFLKHGESDNTPPQTMDAASEEGVNNPPLVAGPPTNDNDGGADDIQDTTKVNSKQTEPPVPTSPIEAKGTGTYEGISIQCDITPK